MDRNRRSAMSARMGRRTGMPSQTSRDNRMTRGGFMRSAGLAAAGVGAAAMGAGVAKAQGNGALILRSPYVNPFYLVVWDDMRTGLSVALAYYENGGWPTSPYEGGIPTLDKALAVFLPENAHVFTPYFPNAAINLQGDNVPAAVYQSDVYSVFDAYLNGDLSFLEQHIVAAGFVSAMLVGRVGAALQSNAVGKVELIEGGTAQLTAMTLETSLGTYITSRVMLR